ncbi:MAG: MATE family efflux transporter [Lachnospiraceae bacterium]|nr:MATE family efflux transporter [Lachnospiraceae bacterium]
MDIKLSDHFTYGKLIRFTLPSVSMMIFTSIYGVVDGYFVSNYAGKTSFAAVNLIMPFIMILGGLGFMVGTGGSALVSMTLGMGKKEEANRIFSMLVYALIGAGLVIVLAGFVFMRPVSVFLGATDEMLPTCVLYGRLSLISLIPFMLMNMFNSFFVTAERPQFGFYNTVAAGVANMVLDWLLLGKLSMGVVGAALATVVSEYIGGLVPLMYFALPNRSLLRLTKTGFNGRALIRTCTNGASEFTTNISFSVVSMIYNVQLMKLAGEDGVAAYGVIMYVCFIFIAVFLGYSIGCAPVIGYHYGAEDSEELSGLLRKSIVISAVSAAILTFLAEAFSEPLSRLFVGYDADLLAMTTRAFRLYGICFLLCSFNIFGSGFFTALNNGAVSAAISLGRTFVFQVIFVFALPLVLGLDGIWLASAFAEMAAFFVTAACIIRYKERYHY